MLLENPFSTKTGISTLKKPDRPVVDQLYRKPGTKSGRKWPQSRRTLMDRRTEVTSNPYRNPSARLKSMDQFWTSPIEKMSPNSYWRGAVPACSAGWVTWLSWCSPRKFRSARNRLKWQETEWCSPGRCRSASSQTRPGWRPRLAWRWLAAAQGPVKTTKQHCLFYTNTN